MAIVPKLLDGQNFSFSITLPDTFVDVLNVNIVTGTVTSAYLPTSWTKWLETTVSLANSVVPALDRTSVTYLSRLVNTVPMDDSVFSASSVLVSADTYALRLTQVAGVDPACLLVGLPHSITGGFAFADAATGLAPPTILAGDVIGPSGANVIAPGVIVDADVSNVANIAQSKIANLVSDLASKVPNTRQVLAGTGLTGGGPLTADVTLAMPNVGTAGTYGSSSTVPVFTTDPQGRVTNVVNTPINGGSFTAIAAQFSDTTDQPLTAGVPRVMQFNTTDYAAAGISVQNNGLGVPTQLTVAAAGVYSFTVSPQLLHTGGTTVEIIFWARINGSDIPNSSSRFEMGNNNNQTLPFLELLTPMLAGQYFEWVFYTSGVNTSLEHFPAVVGPPVSIPATPSIIAGVKKLGV